ncbi:MAG TPA: non-canonical purine NTP pyrophosphatase [Candidatus Saccharimonadales bacterium]
MRTFIFISGNQHKADQLAQWLGAPVRHQKVDLDEIQSLESQKIVEHKARQAYEIVKQPVLVEDVALTFDALGKLPGPFIKWFIEEIGVAGICRLASGLESQKAVAAILYGFYDGTDFSYFAGEVSGEIAPVPRGEGGFGFDACFIPEGYTQTRAELEADAYEATSPRAFAIAELKKFLSAN